MEHGYGTAETLGYEGIPEGVFVEAAHISSTMAGDHDFQLVYSVDEQPMLEPAHIWFEEPVGFGLDLSPWREDAGWSALEALIIHEGEDSVESLRLVSADGVALIGDGDLTVLQDGSGELGEVGEGVEVTGGELQIDLVHVDADGPGTLELLDGTVVSVPAVRVVEDYDELDADWTLQVLEVSADGEQAEHLALQVDDPEGTPFLFPGARVNVLDADDQWGAVMTAVDGVVNDGSWGCTARFSYDTEESLHAVEICVGLACAIQPLPGTVSRDEGSMIDCPW